MPASELNYRVYATSDSETVGASATVTYQTPALAPPAHRIWYVRHVYMQVIQSTLSNMNPNFLMFIFNKVVASLKSATGVTLSQSVNPLPVPVTMTEEVNIGTSGGYIAELELERPVEIDADLGESVQASLNVTNSNTTSETYITFFAVEVIETSKKSVLEA